MTVEKRNTNADINTKVTDSDKKIIEGYGLLFNKPSHPLSSNGIRFIETISKEAVKDINFEDDIRLLLNHDSSQVLARTKAGNLKIEVDDIGVKFRAELNNTSFANDTYENLKVGNVNQTSFAFELPDSGGDSVRFNKEESIYERTIKKFKKISEISVVSFPAYEDTSVYVRSIEEANKEAEQIKELHKRKLQLELDLMKLKGELNKQ